MSGESSLSQQGCPRLILSAESRPAGDRSVPPAARARIAKLFVWGRSPLCTCISHVVEAQASSLPANLMHKGHKRGLEYSSQQYTYSKRSSQGIRIERECH